MKTVELTVLLSSKITTFNTYLNNKQTQKKKTPINGYCGIFQQMVIIIMIFWAHIPCEEPILYYRNKKYFWAGFNVGIFSCYSESIKMSIIHRNMWYLTPGDKKCLQAYNKG